LNLYHVVISICCVSQSSPFAPVVNSNKINY
jgi:hypothetical protein